MCWGRQLHIHNWLLWTFPFCCKNSLSCSHSEHYWKIRIFFLDTLTKFTRWELIIRNNGFSWNFIQPCRIRHPIKFYWSSWSRARVWMYKSGCLGILQFQSDNTVFLHRFQWELNWYYRAAITECLSSGFSAILDWDNMGFEWL